MEVWVRLISRAIFGIVSIVDASNLRNKLYEQREEHEIMWTALDDISRMHKGTPAGEQATRALLQVKSRYGR